MSYCRQFWCSREIYKDRKDRYMFKGMTKNSLFSCSMAPFMSYWPQFWGSRDTTTIRPDTFLRGKTKKLSFSCFMVVFMHYCPLFRGSRRICMSRKPRYMFQSYDKKLVTSVFYGQFHELFPTDLVLYGNLHV